MTIRERVALTRRTNPCARVEHAEPWDEVGGEYWVVRVWPYGTDGPSKAWRFRDHVVAREAAQGWRWAQRYPWLIEQAEELLRDWSIDKGEVA